MIPEAKLKQRWDKLGSQIGRRVLSLPESLQEILLADLQTAIENRLKVMERIQGAQRTA